MADSKATAVAVAARGRGLELGGGQTLAAYRIAEIPRDLAEAFIRQGDAVPADELAKHGLVEVRVAQDGAFSLGSLWEPLSHYRAGERVALSPDAAWQFGREGVVTSEVPIERPRRVGELPSAPVGLDAEPTEGLRRMVAAYERELEMHGADEARAKLIREQIELYEAALAKREAA